MVRVPGAWKTYEELEESISLPELEAMLEAAREIEHNGYRFAASLKGINLDEGNTKSKEERFEELKRKAQAELVGVSEEELQLAEVGIQINYV